MPDVVVPRRTMKKVSEVEGNLIVHDATVQAEESGGVVRVAGVTECRDDCIFGSSLMTSELRGRDGDIIVEGTIDVSGGNGNAAIGGPGGPGGFDGGTPGFGGDPPGDGYGPGAGKHGGTSGGHAAYGGNPVQANSLNGAPYGSPLLVPLVGGSGGGGY